MDCGKVFEGRIGSEAILVVVNSQLSKTVSLTLRSLAATACRLRHDRLRAKGDMRPPDELASLYVGPREGIASDMRNEPRQ